jgi:probable rRNA maturation factor
VSAMIEVVRESGAWETLPDAEAAVRRAIETTLREERVEEGEIAVMLTDDLRMQMLNKNFRATDKATNVLAFPASGPRGDGVKRLGDIVLAYETLAREAEGEGKVAVDHLMHLAAHGTLHLLGYDHLNEADAERMEARERAILAKLGVADPYLCEDAGAAA